MSTVESENSSTKNTQNPIKRTGHSTLVYTAGTLISKLISVIMLPIYTRYLTKSDFGVIILIDVTLDVIGIAAGSSLVKGIFYLYQKAEVAEKRRHILSSSFLLIALAYIIASIIAWLAAQPLAQIILGDRSLTPLIHIAAVSLAFQCFFIVPLAEMQLKEQSILFIVVQLCKIVIQIMMNIILLIYFGLGTRGVLIAGLVSNFVVGLPICISFLIRNGISLRWNAVHDIMRLGVPLIGVHLAKFVMTFGDRYFLQKFANTAVVGLYSLGYQFGILLVSVSYYPFFTAWEPLRFEIAKRADCCAIFNQVFKLMNLVLISSAVAIVLYVSDFLHIAATPPFYPAAQIVPIILIAYIAQSWAGFHCFGLFIAERTEIITLSNWLGAIISLIFYSLLIPKYQAMGAAWATLFSFVATEFFIYLSAQYYHAIDYIWGPTIRIILIAVITCMISLIMPEVELLLSIILHTLLFGCYILLIWNMNILTENEKKQFRFILLNPRSVISNIVGSPE